MNSESPAPRVLIVDDEEPVRKLLAEVLSDSYHVDTADSAESALALLKSGTYAVAICDIDMPRVSGIQLVPRIHELAPEVVVLMISGNLSIEYAVQAIRLGAHDYLTKPFDIAFVEATVKKAVSHHRSLREKENCENELRQLVKQRTEELNFLIYKDSLTKLPNRVRFEELLSKAVIEARHGGRLAVMLLSLNGFAKIRDHFGRSEADSILREMANRLRFVVGDNECLSRIQSDDFAVLLKDVEDSEILDLADRISTAISEPILCQGTKVFFSSSIGVSFYPDDGLSALELLKKAGNALGRAREIGKDEVVFYSDGIKEEAERRIKLQAELRRALDHCEFEVYYQPKVSVSSGEVTGVEALIRWNHPERGLVSPYEFIPLAEETGLIVPLGELVLRTACSDGLAWHRSGYDLDIAVNVSARQLKQSDLAERFESIIQDSGMHPSRLNLEVTESSIMENTEASIAILERLKLSGVQVSLDDFGTGYSSLAHLKKLPIDELKIDREFIKDIANGGDDAVVTIVIVNLAHSLNLKVVAEGVENEEQLDLLLLIGCDQYQGYHFSPPVPAGSITLLLEGIEKTEPNFPVANELPIHFAPHI